MRHKRHAPCNLPHPSQHATQSLADERPGDKRRAEWDKEPLMLVLSRKVGERIHVGENIVLEIRRIAGNRVTLALDAPRDVRILRGELEQSAREFRSDETSDPCPLEAGASAVARTSVTILHSLP